MPSPNLRLTGCLQKCQERLPRFIDFMRVLIIHDEKSIRSSTSAALRAEGHHADVADGSTIALAKLQEEAYDLAFLDLRLGDEDGLNVMKLSSFQYKQRSVSLISPELQCL